MTNIFTKSCFKPYDRHIYEVVLKNHKKVIFEDWDDLQEYWFTHCQIPDFLNCVNIKDKKRRSSIGFG